MSDQKKKKGKGHFRAAEGGSGYIKLDGVELSSSGEGTLFNSSVSGSSSGSSSVSEGEAPVSGGEAGVLDHSSSVVEPGVLSHASGATSSSTVSGASASVADSVVAAGVSAPVAQPVAEPAPAPVVSAPVSQPASAPVSQPASVLNEAVDAKFAELSGRIDQLVSVMEASAKKESVPAPVAPVQGSGGVPAEDTFQGSAKRKHPKWIINELHPAEFSLDVTDLNKMSGDYSFDSGEGSMGDVIAAMKGLQMMRNKKNEVVGWETIPEDEMRDGVIPSFKAQMDKNDKFLASAGDLGITTDDELLKFLSGRNAYIKARVSESGE